MKFSFILPSPVTFSGWHEFESTVRAIARLGYDAVELQLGDAEELDAEKLKKLLSETDVCLSSFQTGSAYAKNGFCYSSADEARRVGALDKMRRFVELASEFGAIPVTGLLQGKLSDEPNEEIAYRRICDCMRSTSELAEQKNVTVVIEPCNKMEVGFNNNVKRVKETLNAVGNSALKTMVDTYHANIEERSVTGALRDCYPVMRHVHLSESNRSDFGSGHMDFVGIFETLLELGYEGYCAVGVYFTQQDVESKAAQAIRYARTALKLAEQKREND